MVTVGVCVETTGTARADESIAVVWLVSVLITNVAIVSDGAMICASTIRLAAVMVREMSSVVSPSPIRIARLRL
jgi:hypothetical protein